MDEPFGVFASRSRAQLWLDSMTSSFLPRMGCFLLSVGA
jgi:hypothetical protein